MAGAISAYSQMTLMESFKRLGFDNAVASIGELLQMIDILDVMPWLPASNGTFNRQLQASRLGKGTFTGANAGVPTISSTGEVIEEPVKLYSGMSIVDEVILQGVEDPWAVRDSEDAFNMEGAFQDWAYNLVYGSDGSAADNFFSFASRRPALTGYTPWVFSGGGSSNLTSAWILELSPNTLYLVYPPNSGVAGFRNEDRGRIWTPNPSGTGNNMWGWARLYQIFAGIVLRNQRSLLRYANLATSGSSNTFSITDFIRFGKNQLQFMGRNAFVFVNRILKGQLEAQAYKDTANGALTVQAIENYGPVTFIGGIPVRMHEGITNAESQLS